MSSNVISSTLNNKDVNELPIAGRNAFTFARLVPGAVAPQGTGSTHFNGMPGGTINPTIDGVNNSSNGFKSGGTSFFGTVPARLGAVEQVTVETAGLGGDDGVTGGVNLKFVTRRGTNKYRGSFVRAVPHGQAQREHVRQRGPRPAEAGAAPPRLRRQLRRPDPIGAEQAVRVRELRGGIHSADAEPDEHHPHRGGAAGNLPVQHGCRRGAVGQRATSWPAPPDSSRLPTRRSLPCSRSRHRPAPYGSTEPGTNLRTEVLTWLEPQKTDQLLPDGAARLPDHARTCRS